MKKYSTFLHHRTTFSGLIISDNHVGNDFEVNTTHVFFLDFCQEKVFLFILHQAFLSTASSNAFVGHSWGGLVASKNSLRNVCEEWRGAS